MLSKKSEEFKIKFQVGEYVNVSDGPFEGSEGKILEINEEKGLLKLSINLLGRDTSVELDVSSVQAKE